MSGIKIENTDLSVGEIRSRLHDVGLTVDAPIPDELSQSLMTRFRFIASELGIPVSAEFSNIIEDDSESE